VTRAWQIALVAVLLGLFALFYQGLWGNPRYIPTILIGTPAPAFSAPQVGLGGLSETLALEQLKGKVVLLNFWASWCQECRLEHNNLLGLNKEFGRDPNFVMLGVNYQDKEEDAIQYLQTFGTNFQHVRDVKGAIAFDYGVYGVPETFVIDQQGVIRCKTIGPIVGPVYDNYTQRLLPTLLKGDTERVMC
jgi:cytochrome c biogenesis protein CcmG/thiol:disulfide interchange protein DsbE